jgi:hypothetical protein
MRWRIRRRWSFIGASPISSFRSVVPARAGTTDAVFARRDIAIVALIVGLAAMVGNLFHPGLSVEADEGSYLLNAAALAGELKHSALIFEYASGYSLLLAPAFLLFDHFDRIYFCALVVNALLAAATPIAVFRLATILYPDAERRTRLLASAAAGLFAPSLVMTQYAMADNALVPLYAWALALSAGGLSRHGHRNIAMLLGGSCLGALVLVHVRGLPMAAGVLVGLLPLFRFRELRRALLVLYGSTVAVALLHSPLEWLAGKSSAHPATGFTTAQILARFSSWQAWLGAFRTLIGASMYVVVASFGVIAFAMRRPDAHVANANRHQDSTTCLIWLACLLGLLACIATTAIFFAVPARLDHVVYGRYTLPAVVPLVSLGFLRLSARNGITRKHAMAVIGFGVATIAAVALLLSDWYPIPSPANLMPLNIVALYGALVPQPAGRISWLPIAVYFAGASAVVIAATRRKAWLGAAVFIALNLGVAAFFTCKFTLPGRLAYGRIDAVREVVRSFEDTTHERLCIGVDSSLSDWRRVDYTARFFDHLAESSTIDPTRCTHGVFKPITKGGVGESLALIAVDDRVARASDPATGLFVEDGPALRKYARTHALPAEQDYLPLPPAARFSHVAIGDDGAGNTLEIGPGETRELAVTVENTSQGFAWPSSQSSYPVRAGARVLSGPSAWKEARAPLPRLKPGEAHEVRIRIGPFAQPGKARVEIGVLQEGVAWFDGSKVIEFDVRAKNPR